MMKQNVATAGFKTLSASENLPFYYKFYYWWQLERTVESSPLFALLTVCMWQICAQPSDPF